MNTVARIALVALVSFAAHALAQESVAAEESGIVRVAALQPDANRSVAISVDAAALDDYAGCYVAGDGRVFIVQHRDGALTIDLPTTPALAPIRLHAVALRQFVAADAGVWLAFEVDAAGRATAAVIRLPGDVAPLAAAKAPTRRGIVTIEDIGPRIAAYAHGSPTT